MGGEIKLDSAPAFQSLSKSQENDPIFSTLKLKLILGEPLNKNNNPAAEATIGELKRELLNLSNSNQPLSQAILSLATRNLNNRVRANGRSALETITSRDLLSSEKIEVDDDEEISNLNKRREQQHEAHERFQAKEAPDISRNNLNHFSNLL